MVNTVVQSPTNPHFFQPLLPGFDSHLNIPITFFSKHVQGRNEYKTVELISDAADMIWEVTVDNGRILSGGWREFVIAHDLRIGDVLVLRHEGDLVFHVTVLGPSFCEVQYVQEKIKPKRAFKKHCRKWKRTYGESSRSVSSSLLSESRFVKLTLTPSSLSENRLYLPQSFTRVNKMENARGEIISLVDKHGVKWPVKLRSGWGNGSMCLGSGIKQFLSKLLASRYTNLLSWSWFGKTQQCLLCSSFASMNLTNV